MFLRLCTLLFTIPALGSFASADTVVAIDVIESGDNYFGPFMAGWQFEVLTPIEVNSLGFYDKDADGLFEQHEVGIWDASGDNLLMSTTVPQGLAGSLVNSFRFQGIDATLLEPGEYVIGGFGGFNPEATSDLVQDEATINTANAIRFIENRATPTEVASLTFPSQTFPDNGIGFFGANFQYTAVPEPSSAVVLSLVAGAGVLFRRKSRRPDCITKR